MLDSLKKYLSKLTWTYIAIISVAACAGFYFMTDNTDLENKQNEIDAGLANNEKLQAKVDESKKFAEQLDVKKKLYADLSKKLLNSDNSLPKQFYLPDLLNDILREGKQLQLEISSIVPDAKEELSEFYGSLSFNLDQQYDHII